MDRQVFSSMRWRSPIAAAVVLLALAAFAVGPRLAAGDGRSDRSFGENGVATIDADPLSLDNVSDMARDAKGRIVLGGTTSNGPGGNHAWFARLKRDGSLDPTFGTGGVTVFSPPGQQYVGTVGIDSEGRIVAGGTWDLPGNRNMWLFRMNPDGTPDIGFGVGGSAIYDSGQDFDIGTSAATAKDGAIYLAGSAGNVANYAATVVRYDANGNPDPTWGVGGAVQLDLGPVSARAEDIALDRRGRVVLAGQRTDGEDFADITVIRLTRKGIVDPTFNRHGFKVLVFMKGQHAQATDLAVDGRGRILVAGAGDISPDGVPDGLLARLKPNGKPDHGFGRGGKVRVSPYGTRVYLSRVGIDRAGRIVLAGSATRPTLVQKALLVRLRSNGRLDRSFGKKGQLQMSFGEPEAEGAALAIDGHGRYLIGGGVFDTGLAYVARRTVKYPRHR